MIYILHFEEKYKHAGHYLGYTAHVERRIQQHQSGHSVPLMDAVNAAGIPWMLAAILDGDKATEKRLRLRKNTPRFCPQCRQARIAAKVVPL
jgi:predicted GIY-YIG superfamily endonuclease